MRIAFLEHGVQYVEKSLNVFEPTPELLAANPFGRVPVLKLPDGTAIMDSSAILSLFYQETPQSPWLARDGSARARGARVTGAALTLCELAVAYFLESLREHPDEKMRADADQDFGTMLGQLEREPLPAADALTQADIDLATALSYLDLRWGTAWRARHPRLAGFATELEKRPAFLKTAPPPM